MIRGNTEVETLKLNGWTVGDVLEGTEFSGAWQATHRIRITAIGEQKFLCLWDYLDGDGFVRESGSTTLAHRKWKKVSL